jgi:hypothetical protein
MAVLKTECNSWNYQTQHPFYEKVFYKYIIKPYKVSQYCTKHSVNPARIKPITDWLANEFPNHSPLFASLMAMYPGQRYPAHRDEYIYSQYSKRLHIPIISKEGNRHVSFHQLSESEWNTQFHVMEEGSLYELSNYELHSAENLSDQWRIHLIVDIAETDLIKSRNDLNLVNFHQSVYNYKIEKIFLKDENLKKWTLNIIAKEDALRFKPNI